MNLTITLAVIAFLLVLTIRGDIILSFAAYTRKEVGPGVLYVRLYILNKYWTPFCIVERWYRCNCADICTPGERCHHHIWHSLQMFDKCTVIDKCATMQMPVKCTQQVYNPWYKFWGKNKQEHIISPDKLEPIEEVK